MLQIEIGGLISGLGMAVLATAFSLVYIPTRVFHVAIGGIIAFTPYVALQCQRWGMPVGFQVLLSLVCAVLLSVACEMLNHAPLESKAASPAAHLVASLGIYIALVQVIALVWGNETQTLLPDGDAAFRLSSGLVLTKTQVLTAVMSIILLGGFHLWLARTNNGLRLRALADNPKELALFGCNTGRLRVMAFGISGLLAGAGALFISFDVGFEPHAGLPHALLAAVAVIMGGRSSFFAPILGGLLLGVLRAQVVWFMSARWQDVVTFLLLAIFLFIRPNGILGHRSRIEAEA